MEKSTDPATGKVSFFDDAGITCGTGKETATWSRRRSSRTCGNSVRTMLHAGHAHADEATSPSTWRGMYRSCEVGGERLHVLLYKHNYYAMENGKPGNSQDTKTEQVEKGSSPAMPPTCPFPGD